MSDEMYLELGTRTKHDDYLQEAARERLGREAKHAESTDDCEEHWQESAPEEDSRMLTAGPGFKVMEMFYQQYAATPLHRHSADQTGYVLSGELRLALDGHESIVVSGDSFAVPALTPHALQAVEESRVVYVVARQCPTLLP